MLSHPRRRFLQTSLAAGAVLGLGSPVLSDPQPAASQPAPSSPRDDNPTVEPGKVRWHRDFGRACTAARFSQKPVFLLQMMGRLDQRFC
jgi:hypothetical protein